MSFPTGAFRDAGEPLTEEDFEFAESDEYNSELDAEDTHDEDQSQALFEGDIDISDGEQKRALAERGVPGLREVFNHSSPSELSLKKICFH